MVDLLISVLFNLRQRLIKLILTETVSFTNGIELYFISFNHLRWWILICNSVLINICIKPFIIIVAQEYSGSPDVQ
jgi:hypothetical protein